MTLPPRYAAEMDGDFVVFMTGVRVNAVWKVHRWVPLFLVAARILWDLRSRDASGLRHSRMTCSIRGVTVIQYWEDFDSLRDYARDPDGAHYDAWGTYTREIADTGAVSGWHETYLVRTGEYEAVYNRMPPQGLAAAGDRVAAEGRNASAAGRLGRTDGNDAVAAPGATTG